MPLSTTIFLYGISIVAGVVLVAFGLLRDTRRAAETAACDGDLLSEMPNPSPEPVPLQFKEEAAGLEDRGLIVSGPDQQDLPLAWHPGSGDPSKGTATLRKVLGAPFAWFRMKKDDPEGETVHARAIETTILDPRQPKPAREPAEDPAPKPVQDPEDAK